MLPRRLLFFSSLSLLMLMIAIGGASASDSLGDATNTTDVPFSSTVPSLTTAAASTTTYPSVPADAVISFRVVASDTSAPALTVKIARILFCPPQFVHVVVVALFGYIDDDVGNSTSSSHVHYSVTFLSFNASEISHAFLSQLEKEGPESFGLESFSIASTYAGPTVAPPSIELLFTCFFYNELDTRDAISSAAVEIARAVNTAFQSTTQNLSTDGVHIVVSSGDSSKATVSFQSELWSAVFAYSVLDVKETDPLPGVKSCTTTSASVTTVPSGGASPAMSNTTEAIIVGVVIAVVASILLLFLFCKRKKDAGVGVSSGDVESLEVLGGYSLSSK